MFRVVAGPIFVIDNGRVRAQKLIHRDAVDGINLIGVWRCRVGGPDPNDNRCDYKAGAGLVVVQTTQNGGLTDV